MKDVTTRQRGKLIRGEKVKFSGLHKETVRNVPQRTTFDFYTLSTFQSLKFNKYIKKNTWRNEHFKGTMFEPFTVFVFTLKTVLQLFSDQRVMDRLLRTRTHTNKPTISSQAPFVSRYAHRHAQSQISRTDQSNWGRPFPASCFIWSLSLYNISPQDTQG